MFFLLKKKIFFVFAAFPLSFSFSQNTLSDSVKLDDANQKSSSANEFVVVADINIIGNKVTKKHIITRELSFKTNDTIRRADVSRKLKSTKENLLNTSLFNFVTVDTIPSGSQRVNILITVAERWYTWPVPIFEVQERNFNTWWQKKDLNRANYGFYLNRENFRGRKEDLSFYFQFGYTEKFGISYKIPYLTRQQNSGAGFSVSYSRNREIPYASFNNEQLYFKNPDKYVREEFSARLNFYYRNGIHNSHSFEGRFVSGMIDDTLNDYTLDYFIGDESQMRYFSFDYSFRSDHRDSKSYPLKGYFMEVEVTQIGFGLLEDEKVDVTNYYLTLKNFYKLAHRLYVSESAKVKFSPHKYQPYYVQKGLGWRDYVRSYEYYVIDGQRYGLAKLGMKYELIKPKIREVPYLPFKKFNTFHYAVYGGIFADAGYVDDHMYSLVNPLSNQFIYGAGIGIDYVTYYDLVIRLEYSINKMKEHGLFLHFNAGI